jgi:glycosyltransferase involved in cell wall biosynthesis
VSRIAIDYTPGYEQGAGIGRYVRELVSHLAQLDTETPYRLFVSGASTHALPPAPGTNFTWKPTRISPRWLARLWHRLHLPIPVETFTGALDLYHATDFVLPPVRPKTRTILTIHDLTFVRVPEAADPPLKRFLESVVPRSVGRATHILAVSEATKADLIALYGTPPEKITVLLHGVDAHFRHLETGLAAVRDKYGIPDRPYILAVGTVQPRKNYTRLVKATALLRERDCEVDLVLAGGRGWLEDPIRETIRTSNIGDHVHMIGFADDRDLPVLLSHAACVAFVSLYEGFGLPVLEGMACGTPVVTSNLSSLPEVAGDAALLIDPYDVEAIAEALQRVLDDSDLRATLVERGYAQAARFTWENSALQLQNVYKRVLGIR